MGTPRAGAKALAVVLPLGVLSLASLAGTLLAPRLLVANPLLLVALSPRAAYLIVAAGRAPLGGDLVVGLPRMLAADPFNFAVGAGLGPSVRRWATRRSRTSRQLSERVTRWGHRGALPLVVVSPTAKVIASAAALGVRWQKVAVADVAGSLGQLLMLYAAGRSMARPCRQLAAALAGHALPAAVGLALAAAAGLASCVVPRGRARCRRSSTHAVLAGATARPG